MVFENLLWVKKLKVCSSGCTNSRKTARVHLKCLWLSANGIGVQVLASNLKLDTQMTVYWLHRRYMHTEPIKLRILLYIILHPKLNSTWSNRAFSLTQQAAILVYWNKRKCLENRDFSSQEPALVHQYGRHFFDLEHQHGHRDVMWKYFITITSELIMWGFPQFKGDFV